MKKILITFFILSVSCLNFCFSANEDGIFRREIMNSGYSFNTTGFINAINKNDIRVVKFFLQAGMNPNATYTGTPAPMYALFLNRNEILDILLENGADPETKVPALYVALKPQNLLSLAIKRGNVEAVEILINHNVDINKPFNKKTPLEYAKKCKQSEIADILIKNGAIE